MGKLKTLNINQTSTELVSVDDIDRLALLISNNELDEVAVKFIEDLIEREGYIDLRDCMDENPTITFSGCLNTPDSVAYEDALAVLEAHGVTNECARKYIRVYTELLDILKTNEGATDGKGITQNEADSLLYLDISNSDIKEFKTIHDVYNSLRRINISNSQIEGDINVDKYNNLQVLNASNSKVRNIEGLNNKIRLVEVDENNPTKINIQNCGMLSLNNFYSYKVLSSDQIDYLATLIKETQGKVSIKYDEGQKIQISDKQNLNEINANAVICLANQKIEIENVIPSWYKYQVFLEQTEETDIEGIIYAVDKMNLPCQLLIDKHKDYPCVANICNSYLTYKTESYFDTKIIVKGNYKIDLEYVCENSNTIHRLMGSRSMASDVDDSFSVTLGIRNTNETVSALMVNNFIKSQSLGKYINGCPSRLIISPNYTQNRNISNNTGFEVNGKVPIYLGAFYNGTSVEKNDANYIYRYKGRIYTLFYFEDEELTHCLVPYQDNKLIDIITGEELINLGTGTSLYYVEEPNDWKIKAKNRNILDKVLEARKKYGKIVETALENKSWLWFTGGTSIKLDTNIKLTKDIGFEIYLCNNENNASKPVLGVGYGTDIKGSLWLFISTSNRWEITEVDQSQVRNESYIPRTYGSLTRIKYLAGSKPICEEFGTIQEFPLKLIDRGDSSYTIYLGDRNNTVSSSGYSQKVFVLYLYNKEEVVGCYIPYKDNQMLDIINDKIISNAGSSDVYSENV